MTKPIPATIFEGRPAVWTPGEAWVLTESGVWEEAHSGDVGMNGAVFTSHGVAGVEPGRITKAKIEKVFGPLPPLPSEAFAQ